MIHDVQLVPVIVLVFLVLFLYRMEKLAAQILNALHGVPSVYISPEDFSRLVEKEESPTVYYFQDSTEHYYYYATIKQDRVYAKSKSKLHFSEKCDVILQPME